MCSDLGRAKYEHVCELRKASGTVWQVPFGFLSLVPPLKAHYGGAKGETVLQVHGVGPFQVMLAKPGAGSGK